MKDWKDILYEESKDEPQTGIFKTKTMIATKDYLEKMVDNYCKEGHSLEEEIGFLQGVQRTMMLMDKIAKNK